MTVNISLFAGAGWQLFDNNAVPLAGGLIYTYVAGTTTPQATYTTSSGSIAHPNPIVLDAYGRVPSEIWLLAGQTYKFVVKTSSGVLIGTYDDIQGANDFALIYAAFAATTGANLVGYKDSGAGSVATTVGAKLSEARNAVIDFGCDNTGATDTTTKLLAFYNASIQDGRPGFIPAGTYKITPGILKFYNGGAAKNWPMIFTAGTYEVTFVSNNATNVNAPYFEWTSVTSNGDHGATWPGNAYWYGGCHGGFTITDSSGQTAANRHGIALTATWALNIGYVIGNYLPGSTVFSPLNTINGFNPDPFATSYTRFEGIEGNYNKGYVFYGLAGVGIDSWFVDKIRAVRCESGVWYGIGQGCTLRDWSVGSCAGWAFDDGTQAGTTTTNRLTVEMAEFDDVQYGIRLNKTAISNFNQIRFNHRYNFSPLNPSGGYWPRTCIDFGASALSTNIGNVDFSNITNRIEAGGVYADLGDFVNWHNSGNINDIVINATYADNGGLGVTDAWLRGVNIPNPSASPIRLTKFSKPLINQLDNCMTVYVGNPVPYIPRSTFGGSANAAQFTATISGTTLDVTAVASGTLERGQCIYGSNIANGTQIIALGTGAGGTGTYTLSISQTVGASQTMNAGWMVPFVYDYYTTYSDPYNRQTSTYTAPYKGLYFVEVSMNLALAVGTRVRMAVNVPNQTNLYLRSTQYQIVDAVTQTYAISGPVLLNAGDTMFVTADIVGASPVQMIVDNAYSENRFTVLPL